MIDLSATHLTRRTVLAGLGGLTAAAVLAACTSSNNGQKPTDAKLTFWMDAVFAAALEKAVAGFRDEFGVILDIQPTEYANMLPGYLQGAPGGSGPDLLDINIDHLGPIGSADLAQTLEFGDKLKNLDPRAVTGYSIDGAMKGLPLVLESTNMWRNPTVIADPLATWDDLANVARGLSVEYPLVMEPKEGGAYLFQGMLQAFGGYVFKQNADGSYDVNDIGIDTPGGVAALQWMATAVSEGWLKFGLDTAGMGDAWAANQVGLYLSGPWMLGPFQDGGAEFAIDTIPAGPAGPAVSWLSARGLIVNPLNENAALASTFLTDYLASDDPMGIFASETSKLSAWVPVQESSANEFTRAFAAAAPNAQPIPQNAEVSGYFAPMGQGLELILQGESSPAEVAANVAQQLRDAVAAVQG